MTFKIFGNIALIFMLKILSKPMDVSILHSSADVVGERKNDLGRILLDILNNY